MTHRTKCEHKWVSDTFETYCEKCQIGFRDNIRMKSNARAGKELLSGIGFFMGGSAVLGFLLWLL